MRRTVFLTLLCLLALAGPASAQAPGGLSFQPADTPALQPYEDGYAIELKGQRPVWFTEELQAEAEAQPGVAIAAPTEAPTPAFVGIRPGIWMLSPSNCTMGWVFKSGSSYGIGTAGHCASAGQPVTVLTLQPGTNNPVLVTIGSTIVSRDAGVGEDFALVSVVPALRSWVSPVAALMLGPCGTFYGSGNQSVLHVGHGTGIGTGGTVRGGLALSWGTKAFYFASAAGPGDSGSPVRLGSFQAAGFQTHLIVDTARAPSFVAGTRMQYADSLAGSYNLASGTTCL